MTTIKRGPLDPVTGRRRPEGRSRSSGISLSDDHRSEPSPSRSAGPSLFDHAPLEVVKPGLKPSSGKLPGIVQFRRHSIFLIAVLAVVTLVWVFILGILIGRGYLTENDAMRGLQGFLTKDPAKKAAPSVESPSEADSQAKPTPAKPELTFYDSLTKPETQPRRDYLGPSHVSKTTNQTRTENTAKGDHSTKQKNKPSAEPSPASTTSKAQESQKTKPKPPGDQNQPATTVKKGENPIKPKPSEVTPPPVPKNGDLQARAKTKPGPDPAQTSSPVKATDASAKVKPTQEAGPTPSTPKASEAKDSGGQNFTLQITAAQSAEVAERIVRDLKAKGFEAYQYQTEIGGKKYYRVRVGRYASRASAKTALDKVLASGQGKAYISTLTND